MTANKKHEVDVNTDSWLTRRNVMDLKRVADGTIRNWEKSGRLKPRIARRSYNNGTRDTVVYDPAEVAKLPRAIPRSDADPGEVAARAFELFDAGESVRAVVVRVRVEPERASELRAEWEECGGTDLVINPLAHAELARLVGPFFDVAGLVDRVRSTLSSATSAASAAPAIPPAIPPATSSES
jgi:hypothetical protein